MDDIRITTRRLDSLEAEVWIAAAGEFTGRMMGPRCRYASTIEVAYYFQPPSRGQEFAGKRVLITEPNLWEPQTPFLYEGVLTFADGRKTALRHGLRRVEMNPRGVLLNQRPFAMTSCRRDTVDEAEMEGLRQAGINTLLVPVNEANGSVWEAADRIGLLVLGLLERTPEAVAQAKSLKSHPSCLGWLLTGWSDLVDPASLQVIPGLEPLLGVQLDEPAELPDWVQFTTGAMETRLPKLDLQ